MAFSQATFGTKYYTCKGLPELEINGAFTKEKLWLESCSFDVNMYNVFLDPTLGFKGATLHNTKSFSEA